MKYFIALRFSPKSLQYPKLQAMQKRFDQNPLKPLSLEMSVLPPFNLDHDLNENEKQLIWDEMSDQLDAQWMDIDHSGLISFEGLDFSSGKKGHLLYLKPELGDYFFHAQEAIKDILNESGAFFKKTKNSKKDPEKAYDSWLVLGRFMEPESLQSALSFTQQEMTLPLHMMALSLDLFETRPNGQSFLVRTLFTFSDSKDKISLEQYHFAGQ